MAHKHVALGLTALAGTTVAAPQPAPANMSAGEIDQQTAQRASVDAAALFEKLKASVNPLLAPELSPYLASGQESPNVIGPDRKAHETFAAPAQA